MAQDDVVLARQAFADAVLFAEANFGPAARELIAPLWWLAKSYRAHQYKACEEIETALRAERRAIAIAETASPPDLPQLARLLTFHGISSWLGGHNDAALGVLTRAKNLTVGWSADTREQVGPLTEILLLSVGKPEEALPYARELVKQEEKFNQGIATSHSLFLLGDCLRRVGPREEARAHLERFLRRDAKPGSGDGELKVIVRGWLDDLNAR